MAERTPAECADLCENVARYFEGERSGAVYLEGDAMRAAARHLREYAKLLAASAEEAGSYTGSIGYRRPTEDAKK